MAQLKYFQQWESSSDFLREGGCRRPRRCGDRRPCRLAGHRGPRMRRGTVPAATSDPPWADGASESAPQVLIVQLPLATRVRFSLFRNLLPGQLFLCWLFLRCVRYSVCVGQNLCYLPSCLCFGKFASLPGELSSDAVFQLWG